jgi:hypothetical protein
MPHPDGISCGHCHLGSRRRVVVEQAESDAGDDTGSDDRRKNIVLVNNASLP